MIFAAVRSPVRRGQSHRIAPTDRIFKGKRITVMGLGLFGGGLGVTKYLVNQGAVVTVTDLKTEEELRESVEALDGLPIRLKLGGHDETDFRNADMVFVNPAVPKDSKYLAVAKANGVPIETEVNLFFKLCPAPIIGVTGSNGKTTTAALIGEILRRIDPRTLVGGNIGGSLLEKVDGLSADVPVVLELSSFQLYDLRELRKSPHIAVVTNLTPNHLDHHSTMEGYIKAKKEIIAHQTAKDIAVLNYDDPILRNWAPECRGGVFPFSAERALERGVCLDGGRIIVRTNGKGQEICGAEELRLPPGRHNLENVLAAVGAAWAYGVKEDVIGDAARAFEGLEHRLEFVREVRGVRYYNDSTATTPESTIAALNSFDGGIVLIAGGYDKGIPFDELAKVIAKKVKSSLLIGRTAERIAGLIRRENNKAWIRRCGSLKEAVIEAAENSESGDVVLLSPACASYDMFRNFEDRGRQFKELVREL